MTLHATRRRSKLVVGATVRTAARRNPETPARRKRTQASSLWRSIGLAILPVVLLVGSAHAQSANPVHDGFSPFANEPPDVVAVQPDGKILVGGQFTTLGGVARSRLGRLHPSGEIEAGFNPVANGRVRALAVQPDGKILVGGDFTTLAGTARRHIGRLLPDGRIDDAFLPVHDGTLPVPGGANDNVHALAVQPDGKIVVGGTFSIMHGHPRARLARLHPDGSVDPTFAPVAAGVVWALAVQRDGKILVGGAFPDLISRLRPDGTPDPAFAAAGGSGQVWTIALQEDGRVLVGGNFTALKGQPRQRLGRLLPNGTLDPDFTATANDEVWSIALQPDGRSVVGGRFTVLGGSAARRVGRLHLNGQPDPTWRAEASSAAEILPGITALVTCVAIQPDGSVVFGGDFDRVQGQVRLRLARVVPGGVVDATLSAAANSLVRATAVQADGGLLLGGPFTSIGATPRSRLARVMGAALDTSFTPTANDAVYAIAVQDDGKILVGGAFTTINGAPRSKLARLHPTGALDTTFLDPRADASVTAIALQEDGKILVAGHFGSIRDRPRSGLARLHTDGTLDDAFDVRIESGSTFSVAVQPDGKILVGGSFRAVGRQPRHYLARLHADGTVDEAFAPSVGDGGPGFDRVYVAALQRDGKILVGGEFTTINGEPRASLARLHPNGALDTTFPDPGASEFVATLAVQADGRITLGGLFSRVGGQPRVSLARLFEDGALDHTLTVGTGQGARHSVAGVVYDAQGKLAVGGNYATLGGLARTNLGRLAAVQAPTGALRVRADGSRVDWIRGGTGPEVVRVTFELSLDGTTWSPLGTGTRRVDGWQLDGLSLPFDQRFFVRARGRYPSGYYNGSQSVIETVRMAYLEEDPDKDGLPTAWELRFGTDPHGYDRDGDLDGDGVTNGDEFLQGTHPNGTVVRYLAEGATSGFFQTRLALLNPSPTPVSTILRFLRADGSTARHEVSLDGQRRATVDVDALPAMADAPAFSTVLKADGPVVLDRTMSWDATAYGSHAETAIAAPATTWYLAEGATHSGFALFYLLQNPHAVAADVRVTYLLPQGPPLVRHYTLAPTSRFNIWVNQIPQLTSTDVSAVIEVTNGPPIIVERAMYLTRGGQFFAAGHASAGIDAPTTTWFLAEGATGPYFDLFVLLANPHPTDSAQVDVTYLLPDGSTREKRYPVAPQSRFTIWVDEETFPGAGKALADTAVSMRVHASNDVPIVVERAMWWPGTSATWHEAHNSAGATSAGVRWALAEGEDGGPYDTETYILIANTSSHAGDARVTLFFEDGTTTSRTFGVARTSRFNVAVRSAFPEAAGRRFGALVESVSAPAIEIVVERAMYASSGGVTWAAGTNALAIRVAP